MYINYLSLGGVLEPLNHESMTRYISEDIKSKKYIGIKIIKKVVLVLTSDIDTFGQFEIMF